MHHPPTRLRKGLIAIDKLNRIPNVQLVLAGHTHLFHIKRFGFVEATCGSSTIEGLGKPAPSFLVHALAHDGESLSITTTRWTFDKSSHSFVAGQVRHL